MTRTRRGLFGLFRTDSQTTPPSDESTVITDQASAPASPVEKSPAPPSIASSSTAPSSKGTPTSSAGDTGSGQKVYSARV